MDSAKFELPYFFKARVENGRSLDLSHLERCTGHASDNRCFLYEEFANGDDEVADEILG